MNNSFSHQGLGRTTAGTMIGILASAALANNVELPGVIVDEARVRNVGQSATAGSIVTFFRADSLGGSSFGGSSFVKELARSYEQFAADQKPLEKEFAELLSANLWELYAR